jgi:hypothetical protein
VSWMVQATNDAGRWIDVQHYRSKRNAEQVAARLGEVRGDSTQTRVIPRDLMAALRASVEAAKADREGTQ